MEHSLDIHQLSKQYGSSTHALNGIDLHIGNGMFGLLGPNGAGKSTLMRTIAGLQAPSSGEILFDGQSIVQQPELIRRQLGYLPQSFGVYPRISAFALLNYIAILKGITDRKQRQQQIGELLALTNLHAEQHQRVATFSGGMLRRFGIAQALLGNPKLIIVDEPTAGLDPEERNRFFNLLSTIGQDRIILLSTHLVDDVYHLCHQMAILHQGSVLAQGNPIEMVNYLRGHIWEKAIDKAALPAHEARYHLLQTHLVGARPVLTAYSPTTPGEGFQPIEPTLSHLYFKLLQPLSQDV